jgi:hypothetical protein
MKSIARLEADFKHVTDTHRDQAARRFAILIDSYEFPLPN